MDSVTQPPSLFDQAGNIAHSVLSHLLLQSLPQLGPATYWALHDHIGDAETILATDLNELRQFCRQPALNKIRELQQQQHQHPLFQQAQKDYDWCCENDIAIVTHDDERYPQLLNAIHQAPPILFVRGNTDNLFLPQLAMVGSRSPTPVGKENAIQFARQLSIMGFVITSGLALGIDAASHLGAMQNRGPTIAVMGTGIDSIYPRTNRYLAEQIVDQGGTLLTEFPLGTKPQANHFPRRNRIISGMSLGVLVVEAAIKSGSLITARYALQHNREVFAIPGSIHNPLSRGCHTLLREGAMLVESVDDMREPLQGLLQLKKQELKSLATQTEMATTKLFDLNLSQDEQGVIEAMGFDIATLESLEQRTQQNPGTLLSVLMALELKNLIKQCPGGYQQLPPGSSQNK